MGHHVGVDVKPQIVVKKTPCPEIMITTNQMEFHALITEVGKGTEDVKKIGENNTSIFIPEIKEIAQTNDGVIFIGRDAPQEGHKLSLPGTIFGDGLKVNITE